MNPRWSIIVLSFCATVAGCTVFENGTRTLVTEPIHYCNYAQRHWEHLRHCRWANEAWRDIKNSIPDQTVSTDYVHGFKAGFTDYLDWGGRTSPPVVPPRRYWKTRYRTPSGYQAIEDWFAGFQDGSFTAQRSGLDRWTRVPSTGLITPSSYAAPNDLEVTPKDEILHAPIVQPVDEETKGSFNKLPSESKSYENPLLPDEEKS